MVRGHPKKFTWLEEQKIIRLYKNGFGLDVLKRISPHPCNISSIWRVLVRNEIPRRQVFAKPRTVKLYTEIGEAMNRWHLTLEEFEQFYPLEG